MIIGLSGKKQHGKNLVAMIIQYLISTKKHEFQRSWEFNNFCDISGWEQKQFASKLKQVVALLIGCNVASLEDSTFKETPLGEEWRVWYYTHYKYPWSRVSSLHNTKEDAEAERLDGKTIPEYFGTATRLESELLTPRKLLQLMGTECGRKMIHPNIWVNSLMNEYKKERKGIDLGMQTERMADVYPDWIITDLRFRNEATAILSKGGLLIRVNRPCLYPGAKVKPTSRWLNSEISIIDATVRKVWDRGYMAEVECEAAAGKLSFVVYDYEIELIQDTHESETALDNYDRFHYTIVNDTNIEELILKVRDILITEKIISDGPNCG